MSKKSTMCLGPVVSSVHNQKTGVISYMYKVLGSVEQIEEIISWIEDLEDDKFCSFVVSDQSDDTVLYFNRKKSLCGSIIFKTDKGSFRRFPTDAEFINDYAEEWANIFKLDKDLFNSMVKDQIKSEKKANGLI